jgi:hypothetical protein
VETGKKNNPNKTHTHKERERERERERVHQNTVALGGGLWQIPAYPPDSCSWVVVFFPFILSFSLVLLGRSGGGCGS